MALSMVLISTSLALSASNVIASRNVADTFAALAAAQSGVDEFSLAVEKCGGDAVGCSYIANTARVPITGADGVSRATYEWKLLAPPVIANAAAVRVQVTGRVRASARTMVADFRTTATLLDYGMFTSFETVSPPVVNAYYGPRSVYLPDPTIRAKANLVPTANATDPVTWSGASGLDICDRTWQEATATPPVPGRATLRADRALPIGTDYTERTTTPGAAVVIRKGACEVPYGTGFLTSGAPAPAQVYTKDSMLLSKLYVGGAGPRFRAPNLTEWGPDSVPAPAVPAKWYRSDAVLGGDPYTGSIKPTLSVSPLALPSAVADVESQATCVFTGQTRIQLVTSAATTIPPSVTTAYVTSPGTALAALSPSCRAVPNPDLEGAGLVRVALPVTASTVFYVKNGTPGGPANPITNQLFHIDKVNISGQTPTNALTTFFKEVSTPTAEVTEATWRARLLATPITTPIGDTLNAWLTELNKNVAPALNYPQYSVSVAGTPPLPVTKTTTATVSDLLFDRTSRTYSQVQRKTCTKLAVPLTTPPTCGTWSSLSNVFVANRELLSFPMAKDVTRYETGAGNAFVEGVLNGNLTIAADGDVVVTEDLTYTTSSNSMLGLVAGTSTSLGSDIEVYHPVACLASSPVTAPGAPCPNDITGLYSTPIAGTDPSHPSRQYTNLKTGLRPLKIYAVMLSPNGSLTLQNPMRGTDMSTLTIVGAVYERHRGWLSTDYGNAASNRSGYTVTLTYDNHLLTRQPPVFAAVSSDPDATTWQLMGVAERQGVT